MQLTLVDTVRRHVADRLRRPGWVLLVELFIGLGWLRAAVEKIVDPSWWSGETIAAFVGDHTGLGVAWYGPIATEVWLPFADSLALVVLVLQLVAGLTLVSGRHVGVGLTVGMFLNLHFVLAGAVDPSAFYLVCQGALALHLLERRRDAGSRDVLELLNVGAVVLFCVTAPMTRTLHPADVIADPAIVLATFGALVFLTTAAVLARRPSDDRTTAAPNRTRSGPAGTFRTVDAPGRADASSLRE